MEGSGWAAELTFGYAPTSKEEYDELGIEEPNRFHPYRISVSTQGLDVLFHDRVILFHQLSELSIAQVRHSDYNNIRGEIHLKHGFSTAITKTSIIQDEHFTDCIDRVASILRGEEAGPTKEPKNYIEQKTYPDEIPEKLLRDRLAEWLEHNPLQKRSTVRREYVVEGIEGFIDIHADNEAWEIKVDQANAYDVYQLFMYMDVGNFDKGFLVARKFTTGAETARDHINNKHDKEIMLAKRGDFPINQPPDKAEREKYY